MKLEVAFLERDEYIEHKHLHDGIQYIFSTGTGRKLSVVRHWVSYGSDKGYYEMARVKANGHVSEPLGYLTVDEVLTIVGYENGEDVNDIELIKSWKDSKGDE
ncbi:hypothetical protein [Staphylococcus sp. IVB6227]|uniref:hypothetical protein n=1 Tax=Staphylococcus sp. IVB6227 TaxID=2989768 RepID=UPI0021D18AD7|nr:hypothetical protein [Staphylococcus sp. IVB6227]UXR77650.1 hypothetical protein MUA92_07135 [Staphylococcus sp. IVB6227]